MGWMLAALSALAVLAIITLSTHDQSTVLFYSRPMPSLAEYTAYPTESPGSNTYEYTTMVAPSDQTYTYSTTAPEEGPYSYSTTQEQGGTYTYNAAPQDGGLTFYNAQETVPQMTVINGYAQTGPSMEKWYTMPVGTLHPLDTAGDWDAGAFDSVNPDQTIRASAPLTLSGEREDGTVAADARSARPTFAMPSHLAAGRVTELLELPSKSAVWNTPASKVAKLSPEDQKKWAKHVMEEHRLHKVWRTPAASVKSLPAAEQKEWAKHVVEEAKEHAASKKGDAKWTAKVQDLLSPSSSSSKHQQQVKAAMLAAAKRRAAAKKHAKAQFDTFGMAELSGAFSGDGFKDLADQSLAGIQASLADHRPCGPACRQRAVQAAQDMIPVK
eukprot:CAMPEP_0181315408 /NCGR_PEP_ID=MMETSP1101-20121128/15361_1 /TAXON_ID=46948 /ORGANISM="Rhodomonas abbreviata, Strain Caron Lab Isolate" /LENGTH=383 /DNA_ID=CAMNT_0023422617 /DNA_START=26 /DNA_END=1177 /DNA_ORIENTATION=+